jgi:UDP-3-O-[3-hydroxymyristoyl] glucosamine N-acyltransferase
MQYTLREIADEIDVELHGDPECKITDIATLQNAGATALSFLANRRYYKHLNSTKAAAVILAEVDQDECPTNYLIAADPYLSFVKAVRFLNPDKKFTPGVSDSAVIGADTAISRSSFIGPNAVIGDNVKIGDNVFIGPNCVIGDTVIVGDSTTLTANVTLCRDVKLGQRVLLHPGVVIGSDGFGIARDKHN